MDSSRKNKTLYIDTEALSTLALVKAGLIAPVDRLMNKEEASKVDKEQQYKGVPFPFSFLLAPKGKRNFKVLSTLKQGDIVDLINNGKIVGELVVDEVFPVDPQKRLFNIYGTNDQGHPGVKNTMARLGELSVCGEYTVSYPLITDNINRIQNMVQKTGAKHISSLMLAAKI